MNASRSPRSESGSATLGESKLSIASKFLRRIIRHLTRRTALLAIILGCVAALVAILVGPSTTVGQVMLVAMGIFVSVVVLPEVPHRLWNVRPDDLAETVPADHLLDASNAIARAIDIQSRRASPGSMLPDNLVTDIWSQTLRSLIDIIDDPSMVVRNLDYSATIEPATKARAWHSVDTTIQAERHLPRSGDSRVWFSYCSTSTSLSAEFDRHSDGCIARELIQMEADEDEKAWFERVAGYTVRFYIDGKRVEVVDTERITTSHGLTLRMEFDSGRLADQFVSTELRIQFNQPGDNNDLPVKFSAYTVVGTASVTVEVRDNRFKIECDEYLSPSNRNLLIDHDRTDRSTTCTIRTSGQTVLPIGAGAVFSWKMRV